LEIPQTTLQLFTKNIDKNSKMTTLITRELTIKRAKAGLMHVDGEPVQTDKDVNVKIVHKGLKVLVPSKKIKVKKRNEVENIFNSLTRWFNE
ncbi:MAG: diacylglycerol kinase family lipid kinase, partial [Proteiniphilum sp.]|nr:diacylglycerol kinase family lipid kinase [Proteiniphilum sp.]